MQMLLDFESEDNSNIKNKNTFRLFRWIGLDNRLLCIPTDECNVGEVSRYTELNEDFTIKEQFHEIYEDMMKVTRDLDMKDVEEIPTDMTQPKLVSSSDQ